MNQRTIRRAAERKARKLQQQKLKAIAQGQTFDNNPNGPVSPEVPVNRSTGPTTPEGKSISSQNATKHGVCSRSKLILETESLDDYKALEARWFKAYNVNPKDPSTGHEAELIRTAVRADWLSQRADRHYTDLEADLFNQIPNLWDFTENQYKALALAQRYRTANANALTRARKALEDYRKNRRAELKAATPKSRPQPKRDLDFGGEDDIDKELEWMRKEAIRLGYANPDGTPTGKKD